MLDHYCIRICLRADDMPCWGNHVPFLPLTMATTSFHRAHDIDGLSLADGMLRRAASSSVKYICFIVRARTARPVEPESEI